MKRHVCFLLVFDPLHVLSSCVLENHPAIGPEAVRQFEVSFLSLHVVDGAADDCALRKVIPVNCDAANVHLSWGSIRSSWCEPLGFVDASQQHFTRRQSRPKKYLLIAGESRTDLFNRACEPLGVVQEIKYYRTHGGRCCIRTCYPCVRVCFFIDRDPRLLQKMTCLPPNKSNIDSVHISLPLKDLFVLGSTAFSIA